MTGRRLFTVNEAADALAISKFTVRQWIARRRIEFVRLGRCVRIPQSAVEQLLEQGTVPAERRKRVA